MDEPRVSSTLDLLAVVEQSRQNAVNQRDAATDHLAALALKALVEGAEPREIARLCGFDLDAVPAQDPQPEPGFGYLLSGWGPSMQSAPDPVDRFAKWLGLSVQRLVRERVKP